MISDFTKEKIGFAVALLAVIFTITPILDAAGSFSVILFDVALTIRHLFYIVSASLGLSVYFYGMQYLTERSLRPLMLLGDSLYAIALAAPVAYLILGLGIAVAGGIAALLKSAAAEIVTSIASAVASLAGGVITGYQARKRLASREKQSSEKTLEEQQIARITRAEELQRLGHHDLAVVESFRAVEAAARSRALVHNESFSRNWITQVQRMLPTEEARAAFDRLRQVRNMAVHAREPVSAEAATAGISAASMILKQLGSDAA